MMHINIDNLPETSAKWQAKAQANLQALTDENDKATRNALIDKFKGYWKLFKNDFKKLSYSKCWYSETRNPYSHYHIDHFRPKKRSIEIDGTFTDGYWWLTFDHKNFRLCGSVGNTKKVDHFAVKFNKVSSPGPTTDEVIYFLDPTNAEDVKLINFDNSGKALPSRPQNLEKWNYERAEYTIENLDLNYPDLVEERKMKWQNVTLLIKSVNELTKSYNEEPTNSNKAKLDSKKNEIRKMLAPCEELTAAVRACLRSCGQNWAYEILEEKIDHNHCN